MEKKTNEEKMMDMNDYLKAIAEAPMPVGTKLSFKVNEKKQKQIMKQRIKIDGKNLNELFALPCVKGIMKTDDGSFRVRVKLATRSYVYAEPGWWIEEEDGKWRISPC